MKKRLIVFMILGITFLTSCATQHLYHTPTQEFADMDYGFKIKQVAVRNINISLIDEGQGEVLLLIHGLGSNAKGWMKNIPELAKKYRVIALDLPGYGKSDKGAYAYSMEFYAQVLKELLDNLGIEKATFIGHSMGGQISITTALTFPKKVEKLVLISPAGFEKFTKGEGQWMMNVMTPKLVKETPIRNIAINLKSNFYSYPDDAEFMIKERIAMRKAKGFEDYCYAVSKNVEAMIMGPVWDKLDKITHKTLIIFGENDGLIPNVYLHGGFTKDIAAYGAEKIPDNKLVMLPECGHFVQFEKPDETNREILNFLK